MGVSSLMMVLRNTVGRYQGRFSRTKSQILRRDYLLLRIKVSKRYNANLYRTYQGGLLIGGKVIRGNTKYS